MGVQRTPSQQGGGGSGGGIPRLSYFGSPTAADYYAAAAGVAAGGVSVLAFLLRQESAEPQASGFRLLADNQSPLAGWEITDNFGVLQFTIFDGTGIPVQTTVAGNSWYDWGSSLSYAPNRDVLVYLRATEGPFPIVEGWVNGVKLAGAVAGVGVPGPPAPSVGTLRYGSGPGYLHHGMAYFEGTLTDAQLLEYADLALGQGRMVAGDDVSTSFTWNNRWDADENTPGATWAPSDGAAVLTRQGAPSAAERYLNRG